MITISYPRNGLDVSDWKERLDRTSLRYEFIMDDHATVPRLVDSGKEAEGIPAIEAYLEGLEQFVKDWYDDRCDKYDFDPDAAPKINGING
ncbi:hypothetical protein [Mucilaginibacter phyllosphaerae]